MNRKQPRITATGKDPTHSPITIRMEPATMLQQQQQPQPPPQLKPQPQRHFTSTGSGVVPSSAASDSNSALPASNGQPLRAGKSNGGRVGGGAGSSRGGRNGPRQKGPSIAGNGHGEPHVQPSAGDKPPRPARAPRPKIPLTNANGANADANIDTQGSVNGSTNGDQISEKKPRKRRNRRTKLNVGTLGSKGAQDLTSSLIDTLTCGTYECMICYDVINQREQTWSCNVCYAVFHLRCVEKWGSKSAKDNNNSNTNDGLNGAASSSHTGWRCPGCQNVSQKVPREYRCFCDKQINPPPNRYITPHSCGQTCSRDRNCQHPCSMQCHPGPCRPCESMAPPVTCYCGKNKFVVRCSELASVTFSKTCGEVCEKYLNCGIHRCTQPCHSGPCDPCSVVNVEQCKCWKSSREVPCGAPFMEWSCGQKCNFEFECGVHRCERECHQPTKHPVLCPLDPKVVTRCPCGEKSIQQLVGDQGRTSCSEDVPTCDSVCRKVLPCEHRCADKCHVGECPPCTAEIVAPCRCGKEIMEGSCAQILRDENGTLQTPLCNRPCDAQKHCKRHRCKERCCDLQFHVCGLLCSKTLRCGQHECQMPCGHPGRCHDCVVGVSFDELTCHCGQTTMYPPIPCGTKPPICTFPCQRPLLCGHATFSEHNCHPDSEPCPPCVAFVERTCACGKKTMKNVPCSRQWTPSCGSSCQQVIPSCGHPCMRFCHAGDCVDADHKCSTRCGRVRSVCGHTCGFPCHESRFCAEDRPCKAQITQTCECGNLTVEVMCSAWKENMGNLPSTVLPCNDACERAKRNRRLAEALDVDTTSVTVSSSSASLVEYSDVLLRHAYTNPTWVKHAEEAFAAFVQDSGRRVFHFPSGKGAGNPFLLELARHYDLSASIIDADRKGLASVTVRKTAAKTATIPPLLLSTAVAAWKPITGSSTASSSKPNVSKSLTATHHREPINALHLASLQFGMDARDLQLLLEPIFVCGNDVAITVKMITDHDAVMLAESSRRSTLSVDDIEALLVGVESEVRNKFVANNWAKDVTLCHASPSGEVILGSKPKASQAMGPGAARAAYAASVRKDVPVTNTYISLSAAPATAAMKAPHLAPKSSGQSRPPSPAPPPPPAPARGERPVTPAPPRPSTPEDWDQESDVLSPVEVPRPLEAVAAAGTGEGA